MRYVADSSYWLYLVHFPLVIYLNIVLARFAVPGFFKFAARVRGGREDVVQARAVFASQALEDIHAFFEPLTVTSPLSLAPPSTTSLSIRFTPALLRL